MLQAEIVVSNNISAAIAKRETLIAVHLFYDHIVADGRYRAFSAWHFEMKGIAIVLPTRLPVLIPGIKRSNAGGVVVGIAVHRNKRIRLQANDRKLVIAGTVRHIAEAELHRRKCLLAAIYLGATRRERCYADAQEQRNRSKPALRRYDHSKYSLLHAFYIDD